MKYKLTRICIKSDDPESQDFKGLITFYSLEDIELYRKATADAHHVPVQNIRFNYVEFDE